MLNHTAESLLDVVEIGFVSGGAVLTATALSVRVNQAARV